MILRQLADGALRGREPVQARRPATRATCARSRCMAEVFELRPHFEWRGLGFISQSAPAAVRGLRGPRRRAPLRRPRRAGRRPEGVPVRRGAQGRHQALGVQGVRHRLHARARDRHLHGLPGGRLRRLLQLRPLRAGAGGRVTRARAAPIASSGSSGSSRPRAPSAPQFKDAADHDGPRRRRQGDADADRGPVRPGLRRASAGRAWPTPARSRSTASARDDDRLFVVKPLRFPGGSIGELAVNGTVNDLAVAGARPLALTRRADPRGGPRRRRRCAPRSRRSRRPPRAAGVEIVAGDTKVVERGHADEMYLCTTGVGRRDPRARAVARGAAARRPDPRLRPDRRARHGDHARPRRVRARRRDRVRHALAVARGRRAARTPPAPACAACATPRAAASPRCSTSSRARPAWRCSCARPTCRCDPAVAGAAEILGIDPMYVANEGKLVAFVAPEARGRGARRAARRAGLRAGGGDRRGEDRAAGDGARGDGVRRPAGDGPARRRPAAADLLRERRGDGATRVRTRTRHETEAITAHVIWMTTGLSCDGDSVAMTVGHQPAPRGHHHRRDPGHAARWSSTTRCSRTSRARSSCRPGTTPRPASSTRSC